MAKTKVISVANQKGGGGKSTSVYCIGAGLALDGKKVLLIDVDPQGDLTKMLGMRKPHDLPRALGDVMSDVVSGKEIAEHTEIMHHHEGFDFVPGNRALSAVETGLVNVMSRETVLRQYVDSVGNIGGQPYWSWYGFEGRVEWCACFVSWCSNECGYIENGIIPKFAGCVNGVQWFKDRGQWADNSIEPTPGMIIFFDWDSPNGSSGPQDGQSDHVGIVEKCENGIVYTVEGNSGDSCRQRQYSVGYYEILGYGIPAY
ncbi:hypothetical protein HNP82_003307 [Catenibacillus scindens]|uniref:CHAP domain-containing protein n=1 Tax=Catenibacillus scindens TaxID=673271 RepID=A0A7W8HEB6_9FIRM|nr:hypothetical protein [Catenibacillus scindens]